SASWSLTWTQYFTDPKYVIVKGGEVPEPMIYSATVVASASYTGVPTVDPNTNIVSFSGTPSASFNPTSQPPDWWQKYVEGQDIPSGFVSGVQSTLQQAIGSFQLPDVNTFALQNLLFPSSNLTLNQAGLPADLVLSGQMAAAFAVTPASVELLGGESQQFT